MCACSVSDVTRFSQHQQQLAARFAAWVLLYVPPQCAGADGSVRKVVVAVVVVVVMVVVVVAAADVARVADHCALLGVTHDDAFKRPSQTGM